MNPAVDVRAVSVDALISGAGGGVLRHQAGVLVVVHIHAVEGDVVLIAARAQHFAVRRNARLQAEQLDNVPGLERKLADLHFRKRVAHRSVDGVDGGCFRRDVDRLRGLAELHAQIERGGRVHQQLHVGARQFRETHHFDVDLVGARRHLDELIFAALVRGDRAVETGAGVAQRYYGAGDDPALRIGHRAAKKGGGLRKAAEGSSRSKK